jgi:RNA polymerase sigma-70 factor (ECF subfamily)
MCRGPEAALHLIDDLESRGELNDYHLLSATRADLHRRLNHWPEAAKTYRKALSQATNQAERRFLTKRLNEVELLFLERPRIEENS